MKKATGGKFPLLLLVVTGMILGGCIRHHALHRTFYISPAGSDNNNGSFTSPWKTLERANRLVLRPGDTILLEGGSVFRGTFYLDSLDSGIETSKVVIGSYGDGYATIDGGNMEGIVATKTSYFKICDLIITGAGRKSGNVRDGILISSSVSFELDNIEVYGFQHCGVLIMGSRNARITHVTAHDNGFAGIHVSGTHANDPVLFDNENLYIGYCKAFNNPGDPTVTNNHSGNGILAASTLGGTIEYCEAYNNGWDMPWTGNGPVGIWVWDCRDITIQFCLSHHNMTNPVAADGGGFDLDGGVSNSVIQYCISWSNQGAGIGLFEFGAAKPWENNVIRYNISQNDGIHNTGSLSVWKGNGAGTMKNCAVYNNTFYNDTARGIALNLGEHMPGITFTNNIFEFRNITGPGQNIVSESFSGNCFWNLEGKLSFDGYPGFRSWAQAKGKEIKDGSITGFFIDPLLADPSISIRNELSAFSTDTITSFGLRKGSPVAGKGVNPGSPFGFENSYTGIDGSPVKHDGLFEIGAVGIREK